MTTTESPRSMSRAVRPDLGDNAAISRRLGELYQTIQEEGVPDRFISLLERLEEAEQAAARAGTAVPDKEDRP